MPQNVQPQRHYRENYSGYPSGQKPSRRRRRHKRKLKRSSVFLLVFVALGVFCIVRLIQAASQTHAVQQEHQDNLALLNSIETALPSSGSSPTETTSAEPSVTGTESGGTQLSAMENIPTSVVAVTPAPMVTQIPYGYQPQMLEKYAGLYQKNNDLIGWLNVNCLYRINFAVVQGKNNFYMNHDFNKQENVNGSAFLDETCKIWPRDDNLIIYAHNMKSGEMFGELNQLQNAGKINQNPFVTFDTLYEQGTYVPLAVFVCSVVQADDYFQFYVRNFKSEAAFDQYINRARELSRVALKADAAYGDELLTLVTCYDQANRQRFVVLLRKLRDNETPKTVQIAFFQESSKGG